MAYSRYQSLGGSARQRASAGPPSGGGGGRKPIGVPEGYVARRPYTQTPGYQAHIASGGAPMRGPDFQVSTAPRYMEDSEWSIFGSMQGEELRGIQARLERAGLLGKNYQRGFFDGPTRNATRELLGYSNQEGASWELTLVGLEQGAERGEGPGGGGGRAAPTRPVHVRRAFVPKPYSPPDYDRLKVTARQAVEDRINRPLLDHEVILLANEMLGDYRRKHDADMDYARKAHAAGEVEAAEAARVQASLGGQPGTAVAEGHTHEPGVAQAAEQVDPEAEMLEFALRHFADRIRGVKEAPYNERANQVVGGIMGKLSTLMGGEA